uniref:Translocon-associated protein subunit delta n=1 Tax=Suricata suricatta TaxID=37032 RepID=A0A673VPW1_SURSU
MAALASLGALALLLLSSLSCCSAEACVEPQITPSYYTTSDAVISTETVFIVEISLTCKNRVQNMALYADVSGKQFPVTRGQDVGRYQVSWSLDHKSAHAGTYEVRFFDEESYSLLRKVSISDPELCPGLQEGGGTPFHSCLPPVVPLPRAPGHWAPACTEQADWVGTFLTTCHACLRAFRVSLARRSSLPWLGPMFLRALQALPAPSPTAWRHP